MRRLRMCFSVLFVASSLSLSGFAQTISFTLPTPVTIGTPYTVNVTASVNTYVGTTDITTSDAAALLKATSVTFVAGKATFVLQFSTPGPQTVTLTDKTSGGPTFTAATNVQDSSSAAIAACGSCYASLGAGAVLSTTKFGDYNNSSNVLQTTHIGSSTPQYVAGVAYKLPIRTIHKLYGFLGCSPDSFFSPATEAQAAYCYPFKAFISLKFSPDSSQTFNGFTYGLSHALHKRLDIMFGISYSAHNEISPGFQQAALNTVTTQQALSNKYYAQWNVQSLKTNNATAYDGFPTQLQNADGTTGALIYTGNPLVLHYHTGFFLGVSLPIAFKSGASGGN